MVKANYAIQLTTDYRIFQRSKDNRNTDTSRHQALFRAMQKYGFLACFPVVCRKSTKRGCLVVIDGQHRVVFAEQLKLPIFYVVTDATLDVAEINSTSRGWSLIDYATNYAVTKQIKDYEEGLNFCADFGTPISLSFAALAGTVHFGNISEDFRAGLFRVVDREFASSVGHLYLDLCKVSSDVKGARMLEACLRVSRVSEFDRDRLLAGAYQSRERLVKCADTDCYMRMLEDIYNLGRNSFYGLRAAAIMAMRLRRPIARG